MTESSPEQELAHPFSQAQSLYVTAWLRVDRGEGRGAQEHADRLMALASEYGFPDYSAMGTILRGAALLVQGQWTEGIGQIRQGQDTFAGGVWRTVFLAWLAAGHGGVGQVEDGLAAIAEALRLVEKNDERLYEAEVWRIKGELMLQQESQKSKGKSQRAKIEADP